MKKISILLAVCVLSFSAISQTDKYQNKAAEVSAIRQFYKIVFEVKDHLLTPELEEELIAHVDFVQLEELRKDNETVEYYVAAIQKTLVLYPRKEADKKRDEYIISKMK